MYPTISSTVRGGSLILRYLPHQVRSPFASPSRAMIQRRVERIMPAILRPSQAPLAKAWRELAALCSSSSGITIRPVVSVSSVSGYRNFEMAREAGIDMTPITSRSERLSKDYSSLGTRDPSRSVWRLKSFLERKKVSQRRYLQELTRA